MKLSGSYESVVRGVSEQAAQNRRSGQHFAQSNMISDPVRGLARRHGSVLQDEVMLGLNPAKYADLLEDTTCHRVYPFFVGGNEYDLIVRSASDKASLGSDGFAWVFSKKTGEFVPTVFAPGDVALQAMMAGGVSAAVNIGRYVYLAGNTVLPTYDAVPAWDNPTNRSRIAATVLAGAYSRTFAVTLQRANGTKVTGSYTTPSSSYPGVLTTSDIPLYNGSTLNDQYQKQINDRVNAYNGEVTKWVGTAAAAITPKAIANGIRDSFQAQGVVLASSNDKGTLIIEDSQFVAATGSDGGDDSLMRVVGTDVDNIDLVNTYHYVGKVVRIPSPTTAGNAVYLKAVAKDGEGTGWSSVIWRETAGYIMTPRTVFVMATIENGIMYFASDAATLSTLTGVAVPTYKANTVGDDVSSPLPELFSKGVTYLGVFQDRLVIGSGATLLFSRPGDYLNWFRKSVTTIADDDPWEGFALGSEDDTIKWSTLYDRNLLLYGKRFQYVVSGRQPFTPKTASIIVATAFEDAVDARPEATGNYVIYSKYSGRVGSEVASVHQVQAGAIADTPESYKISQQLDTYLKGVPLEILTFTAPNMVLLRTRKERRKLFTYSYLDDAQNGRLFDSWSDWEWSDCVGDMVGVGKDGGDVLVYTIKTGTSASGVQKVWLAAERFVRDTTLSDYPYLDSLRPLEQYETDSTTSYLNAANPVLDGVAVAIDGQSDYRFIGMPLDSLTTFKAQYAGVRSSCWVGATYTSYVTPTNPYVKDRNDQPILSGRLTLMSVKVAVADTGGMEGWASRSRQETRTLNFVGRILGGSDNKIGRQPIINTTLSVVVGGEVKECSYTLKAKTWLPLTITSIDWTGQWFFNTRRA